MTFTLGPDHFIDELKKALANLDWQRIEEEVGVEMGKGNERGAYALYCNLQEAAERITTEFYAVYMAEAHQIPGEDVVAMEKMNHKEMGWDTKHAPNYGPGKRPYSTYWKLYAGLEK